MHGFGDKVSLIWAVADLLRGDFRQSEYGRVILPFLVLRRIDQVLAPTRDAVRRVDAAFPAVATPPDLRERALTGASGLSFYNTSALDLASAVGDDGHVAANLEAYVDGFSPNVRDIMAAFRFKAQIERLAKARLLYKVARRFLSIDLDPYRRDKAGEILRDADGTPEPNVTNHEMGYVFEELIRKFSEQSNETAGEHFTPREVIGLMVELLFAEDREVLQSKTAVRSIYDPACGTGGMLSVAEEHLAQINPAAGLDVFGQELNPESYAICKADMLIKGHDADNIKLGNSFSADGLPDLEAEYLISNPPFGVDWSKVDGPVRKEHALGEEGRFGPGLPRKNDGSLLFLLHMLSKMRPAKAGGSRLAIVFNGSPLFTGAAGSGESEIRRHILENDWLEAIVALPDQMFYNTGISTYVWVLSNRKAPARVGRVQLIDGSEMYQKMRKSLGDKRKELGPDDIAGLVALYGALEPGPRVKIVDNEEFGFHRITVERPLRLDFCASEERIARLEGERGWQNLARSRKKGAAGQKEIEAGVALQDAISQALHGMGDEVYMARPPFVKALKAAFAAQGLKKVPAGALKAVLSALGARNPDAAVCQKKGAPEPDTDLRDYENVPLTESIDAYMKREVLPFVPDAWVDASKTKVGYEIPFTRYFYRYEPPRPVAEIDAELRAAAAKIQGMLAEVLG